jgi:ribokinase
MSDQSFVTAGGLRIDYLITRDGETYAGLPGGNALYAAAGAAFWTDGVALWARYGRNYPQQWLNGLNRLGLDTHGLVGIPGDHDHRTFYAYTPDGRRDDTNPAAHFARLNLPLPGTLADYVHSTPRQDEPHEYEPLAPRPDEWPDSYANVTAVHLSPLPLATHLHVPEVLRRQGIRQISIDPGERYMIPERIPYIRQILPTIDAFLPSDQEVRSLFGDDVDLIEAANNFCEWGVPLVVIKIGADGVLVRDREYDHPIHLYPYHLPGDSRVIDVTGAGDAFCGGFMVGLAKTADPIQAAHMGLVSSSLIIEGYGALYALKISKEKAARRLGIIWRCGRIL